MEQEGICSVLSAGIGISTINLIDGVTMLRLCIVNGRGAHCSIEQSSHQSAEITGECFLNGVSH